MHPAPVDRLLRRRPFRRTGRRSIVAAILLHMVAIAALIVVIPSQPASQPPVEAAPADVALLFEGGSRQASPLPPTERPSLAPQPSPTPGVDAENAHSSGPPPPAAPAPATLAQPAVPAEVAPAPATLPTPPIPPSASQPEMTAPGPAVAPAPPSTDNTALKPAAPSPPDEAALAPPPPPSVARTEPPETVTAREPSRTPARPPSRPPPRIASRPPTRTPTRPSQPRTTADGFPVTLFGSTDLSKNSSVERHAANGAPPRPAAPSSLVSDVHGGEALGADWFGEFSRYVEEHKFYPEQARENGDEGDSTVQIVVDRDGRVSTHSVDLVSRSGSAFLDIALESLFRGKQLPPFPPGAPHDTETITVTMHYYLIRR